VLVAVLLWISYPLARVVGRMNLHVLAVPLEFLAGNWMGMLFLLLSLFLILDALTLGGWLFPSRIAQLRGWTALLAVILSLVALAQGLRPPVLREYAVTVPELPARHDGLKLVMLSDLHLGVIISKDWMAHVVRRVNELEPDIITVVGDLVDSDVDRMEPFIAVLKELQAPLGVYAVTGNHEYYAGLKQSVELMEQSGFVVLRDEAVEAVPGLTIAGVDDLTAREQFGQEDNAVRETLEGLGDGAVIFLSHSPLQYETAAELGADVMLSGHTHNGQIWPFNYLVRTRYPLVKGQHEVGGMTLLISRGAGTWGPRMRLWRPSEILVITLRADAN